MAMADTVDEFLEQWAKQRPDLDVSPMGVIGRLSRASRFAERSVRAYFAEEGMEPWEFDVLATLRRSGPPYTLTPKELVSTTMVGSAAMTHRVDRLIARGLVSRAVDPDNRRRLFVSLTDEGIALVDRVVEGHLANEHRLLEGLDAGEREELNRLLRRFLESLGDHP
ncbi:MarR family transcriptional regulator [Streptomyces sp. TRM 70351]|uniref:MarR family winged helix-turn-helix transcriptional regulator n=1 Tax=Streptomyces sp. TRM 70351 TaxID=3116552 RepID=UPI002E7BD4AD|nr:MarR family transcriptional regulator [Streptomyces sp. TRM 70351]MEE1931504.1 MarR family transcriptional regulator [Streptomyces sp. TRM 70351]